VILQFDQGNTRIKWRLRAENTTVAEGAAAQASDDVSATLAAIESRYGSGIQAIQCASVAGSQARHALLSGVESIWPGMVWVARTQAKVQLGEATVVNSYADVSAMGVDRWLAIVAAVREFYGRPILVVDAGSALTLEAIAPNGQHLGGYIVPGSQMMHKALFAGTGQVKITLDMHSAEAGPGVNTQSAVNNGIYAMSIGLVESVIAWISARCSEQPQMVITGGGRQAFADYFKAAQVRPDLVLDGLDLVAGSTDQ
jgi:type III pantothenate kinase